MLPVGDGEMKNVVNAVTLICEILCAMLLVRQLRKWLKDIILIFYGLFIIMYFDGFMVINYWII